MPFSKLSIRIHESASQIIWQRNSDVATRISPPILFNVRYDNEKDLIWYTRKWQGNPKNKKKAKRIEADMKKWGESVFKNLFENPEDSVSASIFEEAVAVGLDNCELVIISSEPGAFNFPWELLRSPELGFLVPQMRGLCRALEPTMVRPHARPHSNSCLHILFVLSRPTNQTDLPPGIYARPFMRQLRPYIRRGLVKIKFLRPPTLVQFQRELRENKGLYQVS